MREINRVLKKVKEKESKVLFTKIGEKNELSDASYHYDDKSVEEKSEDWKGYTIILKTRTNQEGLRITKSCRNKITLKVDG